MNAAIFGTSFCASLLPEPWLHPQGDQKSHEPVRLVHLARGIVAYMDHRGVCCRLLQGGWIDHPPVVDLFTRLSDKTGLEKKIKVT
jgi:hypothetical protein